MEKCYSQRLQRTLLERNNITFPDLRTLAQSLEASDRRYGAMEGASKPLDETGAMNKLGTSCKHVKNVNS